MTQSPPKKQPAAARSAKPGKHDDLDSRLEYYRKKYGEDFELKESTKSESSTKGSRPPQQSKQKKQSAAKSTSDNSEKSKKPGLLKRLFNKVSTK
ncbi:MAG: hypothetical protein ACOC7X_10460 [Spirochaetota bacterium]